jgi:hypothetical protein
MEVELEQEDINDTLVREEYNRHGEMQLRSFNKILAA